MIIIHEVLGKFESVTIPYCVNHPDANPNRCGCAHWWSVFPFKGGNHSYLRVFEFKIVIDNILYKASFNSDRRYDHIMIHRLEEGVRMFVHLMDIPKTEFLTQRSVIDVCMEYIRKLHKNRHFE